MKLNKFFILLAAICSLAPSLVYPVIVRIERYEKPGCATIDLLHDKHINCLPEQERTMVKMLAKQRGHVCVEDMTEHVGSENIRDSIKPLLLHVSHPGRLEGLVSRLQATGISASSVECRGGLTANSFSPEPETYNNLVADDYRKIRDSVKVANPTDSVDKLSNMIIESVEKCEDNCLSDLLYCKNRDVIPGFEVLDVLALKELCKKDQYNYKALIAGSLHCGGVALILELLDYKRTKCLEEKGKDGRCIRESYKPFLPTQNSKYTVLSPGQYLPASLPGRPLPSEEIKEYFKKPDSYKAS